jgi:hypothetical protein
VAAREASTWCTAIGAMHGPLEHDQVLLASTCTTTASTRISPTPART